MKGKSFPLLFPNHQVLLLNWITKKKIMSFIKDLESSPRLTKTSRSYQKMWLGMRTIFFSNIFLKIICKKILQKTIPFPPT